MNFLTLLESRLSRPGPVRYFYRPEGGNVCLQNVLLSEVDFSHLLCYIFVRTSTNSQSW